jgi:hypothetical protein
VAWPVGSLGGGGGGVGGLPTRPGDFLTAEGWGDLNALGGGGGGNWGGPAMQIFEERGGAGEPARRLLDVGGTRRSQR